MYMTTEKVKPLSTDSNIFVRAMLEYSPMFYGNTYYNTFISIEPELMYLVFHKTENVKSRESQEIKFSILKTNIYYCGSDETENFFILMFYIPEKYMDDFYKVIDGKYSRTSDEYKNSLLGLMQPYSGERTTLYKILYPQPDDIKALSDYLDVKLPKDAEIKSRMDLKKEVFKYENFE